MPNNYEKKATVFSAWLRRGFLAHSAVLPSASGSIDEWKLETPTLIRYGELTNDEFFVTECAAKNGVRITNASETEPIVMLKHFAKNPELKLR